MFFAPTSLPPRSQTEEWFGRLRAILFGIFEVLLLLLVMIAVIVFAWEHTRGAFTKPNAACFPSTAKSALMVGRTPGPLPTPPSACVGWMELISLAGSGSRGTRADQGVRPTVSSGFSCSSRWLSSRRAGPKHSRR